VILLAVYLYPVVAAESIYACRVVAWLVLGRRPRPSLDDLGNIGGIIDGAHTISVFAFMCLAFLIPHGFAASFSCSVRATRGQVAPCAALAFAYVVICAAVLLLLRTDPSRIGEWWID